MIENEIEVPIEKCIQSPLMISPFSTEKRLEELHEVFKQKGTFERPRCTWSGHEFVVLTNWDVVWYLKNQRVEKIKVLLGEYSTEEQVRLSIFEQQKILDLNWICLARAIAKAKIMHDKTDEFFAKASGFDRSRITRLIHTANKLSPSLQKMADLNRLTFSTARELSRLKVSRQEELAVQINARNLSANEILELAFPKPVTMSESKNDIPVKKDRDTLRLEIDISERVGYPVTINPDAQQIDFQFFSFNDLVHIANNIKKSLKPNAKVQGKLVLNFGTNENLDLLVGGLINSDDD
jgi:ParB-like chromosome segregation protein Spo0J